MGREVEYVEQELSGGCVSAVLGEKGAREAEDRGSRAVVVRGRALVWQQRASDATVHDWAAVLVSWSDAVVQGPSGRLAGMAATGTRNGQTGGARIKVGTVVSSADTAVVCDK